MMQPFEALFDNKKLGTTDATECDITMHPHDLHTQTIGVLVEGTSADSTRDRHVSQGRHHSRVYIPGYEEK